MKNFILLLLFLLSHPVFANLPYFPIQFPKDEAAHFENVPYPIDTISEWWYYNGKLTTNNGRKFGFYLNYFYLQFYTNGKKIVIPQFTIQLTDIDQQKVYGKRSFFLAQDTNFSTSKLDIKLGKNITLKKINNIFFVDAMVTAYDGMPLKVSMQFTPTRNALLVGKTGLVDMWDNTNSYYYSYTHLNTSGNLQIGNQTYLIDSQQSLSWMDHQWGDFLVTPGKNQWLWTSIQLENNLEINLFVILDKATLKPIKGMANIIMPDDSNRFITDVNQFSYIPGELIPGQKHPLSYDLSIPEINLQLKLNALAPGQDSNLIWEGVSEATGAYLDLSIHGQAYTENTVFY